MNVDRRVRTIEAHLAAVDATMRGEARAVEVAVREMNRRLDELNKLRQEVTDDRAGFVLRAENDVVRIAQDKDTAMLRARVEALETWKAKATGAAVILTIFAGVIGGAIVKAFGG